MLSMSSFHGPHQVLPHCATASLVCQLSNPDLQLSVWNGARFAQLYKFPVVRSDRRVNELAGVESRIRRRPFIVFSALFRRLKRLRPPARPTLSVSDQRGSRDQQPRPQVATKRAFSLANPMIERSRLCPPCDCVPERAIPNHATIRDRPFVQSVKRPKRLAPDRTPFGRCNRGEYFIPKGCKRLAPGRAAHPGVLTRKQGSLARVPAKAGTRAGDGFM